MPHIHMPDTPYTAPAPPLFEQVTDDPGKCTRKYRKGRLVVVGVGSNTIQCSTFFMCPFPQDLFAQARHWTIGAIILFFVPAFVFLTFEIFLQASELRKVRTCPSTTVLQGHSNMLNLHIWMNASYSNMLIFRKRYQDRMRL